MSIDRIFALPEADAQWDNDPESPTYNPQPQGSVEIARYASKVAYLCGDADLADWPGTTYQVGAWDSGTGLQEGQTFDYGDQDNPHDPPLIVGTPTNPVLIEYDQQIAGMHNENGRATDEKDTLRWQGHSEIKALQGAQRYADTNSPFSLRITRQFIDDDGFPQIPWGWQVDMISEDPARDITARGIGIYSDPECTQYLYTTGAFVDDGAGNFHTVCPVGQRQAEAGPVYFALLLGSLQEGYFNLIDEEVGATVTKLFWSDAVQTLDMDGDGLPDSDLAKVGNTRITEDTDSYNIELGGASGGGTDGEAEADIIIRKP